MFCKTACHAEQCLCASDQARLWQMERAGGKRKLGDRHKVSMHGMVHAVLWTASATW